MAYVMMEQTVVATPHSILAKYLLGTLFLVFLSGTVALYFWGPWQYPMDEGGGRLVGFLAAVHLAFALGYVWAVHRQRPVSVLAFSPERLVLVAVVVELALLFPTSAYNTGHWVPQPWAAAQDLATAYTSSLELRETGTPYVNYVRMFAAPVLALTIPLGVFYWHRLSTLTRILFALSVIGNLALFIAMGANAGAAHWMALFPWFVLAGHLSGVQRLGWRGWSTAVIVQVLSAVLFGVLFTATMVQRTGSFAKYGHIPGIGANVQPGDAPTAPPAGTADASRDVVASERSDARIGADGLAAYLTQGYYAVYLSLDEPFVPCYGVGNSMFLQRQVSRVTGSTYFLKCSYPHRIEASGWRSAVYWATAYPWIASDVTFPGTVLVMLLLGWITGVVWIDVLGGRNVFAVALLGQLILVLYYLPAHNKSMHSGEGLFGLAALLLVWLITRYRTRA